jgi:orotate phosphoribosyltransferase
MTNEEAFELFRQTGALLQGHFILRSGRHSGQYFQCALALQQMPIVERFGAALAERIKHLRPATVVAPAMGGLVIGQEVARQLGARFIFVEKDDGRLVLRRGFKISPGEQILIVEDVVTKGGRVRETVEIIQALGGHLLAVAVLVDRSEGGVSFGVPFHSLIQMVVTTYDPSLLPADLAAIPAEKPGSK